MENESAQVANHIHDLPSTCSSTFNPPFQERLAELEKQIEDVKAEYVCRIAKQKQENEELKIKILKNAKRTQ